MLIQFTAIYTITKSATRAGLIFNGGIEGFLLFEISPLPKVANAKFGLR